MQAVASDSPSPAVSGADALVRALIDHGARLVFGYPGGAIMPVYDALYRCQGSLRHVLVRHEQGAAHAAAGYARVTGEVGVCLGTSGPGATNLLTGLADALMDSTPIVALTGQVPSPLLGSDAFQEADIIGMSLAATKWSYQITDPAEIPWAITRAFDIARSGRPGPVLLDITKDAQIASAAPSVTDPGPGGWPTPPAGFRELTRQRIGTRDSSRQRAVTSDAARAETLDAALERVAALIDSSTRPYLLAGQGVLISGAEGSLLALAERAGIPVACTLLGLSAMPADHPLYVGLLGMHGNYGPNVLTNEADVIVAVGMRFDDRVTGRLDAYAPQARIVHIDIDPAEIGKNVPTEVGIVCDAQAALQRLAQRVAERRHPRWLAEFARCDVREDAAVRTAALAPSGPALGMGEVVGALSERTRGEAIIVSDVGQHQMHAARYYRFAQPRSHITSGGLGTMGFALPAAIGAALGAPQRRVVAIAGDGGFQMNLQELGTLMQERLPVKVVILNNDYLGMVRQWQELFFDGRYSEVRMENPDFVQICAGYRIPAERVSRREQLGAALERMLAAEGPFVLEVAVQAEENVFPMVPAGQAVDQIQLTPQAAVSSPSPVDVVPR